MGNSVGIPTASSREVFQNTAQPSSSIDSIFEPSLVSSRRVAHGELADAVKPSVLSRRERTSERDMRVPDFAARAADMPNAVELFLGAKQAVDDGHASREAYDPGGRSHSGVYLALLPVYAV